MAYSHSLTLAWSEFADEERRFRRFVTSFLLATFILGIAIPLLPIAKKAVTQVVEPPSRIARLIFEKRVPIVVKPKPVKKKAIVKTVKKKNTALIRKKKIKPNLKPIQKVPAPVIDKIALARKKAATSGLLALQDSLSDLRNTSSLKKLRAIKNVNTSGDVAKKVSRSIITSKISSGSQGIDTNAFSRNVSTTKLARRNTTVVSNPIDTGSYVAKRTGNSLVPARSVEEIQIVFDKNKGSIFSIYNRALRKDPTLRGKLVLQLTIASSGKVSNIELISSELGESKLEKKLLRRIKLFNFGTKNVGSITVTYPIDFLPV